MKIGFIGAGKVGATLGKYFGMHGAEISGYCSRSPESAAWAAAFTGSACFDSPEALAAASDAVFLTVPDGQIAACWEDLRQLPLQGKSVCHCSGALSSAVFAGAEEAGVSAYSIHPLFAVSSREDSWQEIHRAVFAIEGSGSGLDDWENFLQSMGNTVCRISGENKDLYHAAAVMASNLVIGLFSSAAELLEQCGFSREAAPKALEPLFRNNCESLLRLGAEAALTGPVERADAGTVQKHLAVLPEPQRSAYVALSEQLVEVAGKKHPERSYEEIKKLLR